MKNLMEKPIEVRLQEKKSEMNPRAERPESIMPTANLLVKKSRESSTYDFPVTFNGAPNKYTLKKARLL